MKHDVYARSRLVRSDLGTGEECRGCSLRYVATCMLSAIQNLDPGYRWSPLFPAEAYLGGDTEV